MANKLPNRNTATLWLKVVEVAPPLFVALAIGPEVWRLIKSGAIAKIGIGQVNLELAQRRLITLREM
jgi:hypothetical protein